MKQLVVELAILKKKNFFFVCLCHACIVFSHTSKLINNYQPSRYLFKYQEGERVSLYVAIPDARFSARLRSLVVIALHTFKMSKASSR